MKILIADDNGGKLIDIQEKVLNKLDIHSSNITVVPDIITAKRELKDNQFDLFIVDIQLPLRFQELPRPRGGLELIKEIQTSERYQTPLKIIGLTEYEESMKSVYTEFESYLHSLVKFDRQNEEWVIQLKNQINHIIKSKKDSQVEIVEHDYDLAIICALENVELDSLKNLPVEWEEVFFQNDNSRYFSGIINKGDKELKIVISAAIQMGMVASSVLTMKVISHFRPRYLAMSGIMAGVKGKVNLGDIIVFDSCWDYGNGKIIHEESMNIDFLPDPLPLRLDPDLKGAISRLSSNDAIIQEIKSKWPANKPSESLSVHIGSVATGSAVLANADIVKEIGKHSRNLLGVEMEAYGVLYAATHATKPRPQTFIVKSICDFADENKNDSYQAYAAYTSATFIYNFAISYLNFE